MKKKYALGYVLHFKKNPHLSYEAIEKIVKSDDLQMIHAGNIRPLSARFSVPVSHMVDFQVFGAAYHKENDVLVVPMPFDSMPPPDGGAVCPCCGLFCIGYSSPC
jgi:hypothetical protein